MKGKILLFILISISMILKGQNDYVENEISNEDCIETKLVEKKILKREPANPLQISGFIDTYYSYDLAEPVNHQKPSFFYNHTQHNEFNVNLALVQFKYSKNNTRGSIGLMTGTYPQYNLSHEKAIMRNIFEANGGVELIDKLWLDAGVFGSHLGFESAISSENITLTRSIMAESSPYYLSGAKFTYSGIEKWTFLAVVSNGWQNISELDDNKAFGTQIVYEPSNKLTFNYSTMLNKEEKISSTYLFGSPFIYTPLKEDVIRFFNDFYAIVKPNDKLKLIFAFDYGIQEGVSFYNWESWYAPAILASYDWSEKFTTGIRTEYYNDERGVIIQPNFAVFGSSLNLDYKPSKNAVLRVEGKWLYSEDKIFMRSNNSFHSDNVAITTSLAITFGK